MSALLRFPLPSVLLVLLLARSVSIGAQEQARRQTPSCRATLESSRILTLEDGRRLYVEPQAAVVGDSEVLLAGSPTITFPPESGASPDPQRADSIFGVLLRRDGRARAIPSPIPDNQIADVSATQDPDGSWSVVFARVDTTNRRAMEPPVIALHYGVYDGTRWRTLDTIPLPPGASRPRAWAGGGPVWVGDSLVWSATVSLEDETRGVVFVRRGGRWTSEVLPSLSYSYVKPWVTRDGQLAAIVVRLDTAMHAPNALWMYLPRPAWHPAARIAGDALTEAHFVRFASSAHREYVVWERRRLGSARRPPTISIMVAALPADERARLIMLEDHVDWYAAASAGDGPFVVTLKHRSGTSVLHFSRLTDAGVVDLGAVTTRLNGTINAFSPGPDRVTVYGEARATNPTEPGVHTLLLDFRITCAARAQ